MSPTLIVAETFKSIQGESSHAGKLTFFIRLAGCNLRCKYCDTEFALLAESGVEKTVDEIVEEAKKSKVNLIEITGGEPLAQNNTLALCEKLLFEGFEVMIETNGSYPIEVLPKDVIKILDCKTPSSGEFESNLYSNFQYLSEKDEVKFVISDFNDYIYAIKIIDEYELSDKVNNILLSPILDSISASELVELMLQDNVPARLQLQIHKFIWDKNKRGV